MQIAIISRMFSLNPNPSSQKMKLAEISNLERMIRNFGSAGADKVIVISPHAEDEKIVRQLGCYFYHAKRIKFKSVFSLIKKTQDILLDLKLKPNSNARLSFLELDYSFVDPDTIRKMFKEVKEYDLVYANSKKVKVLEEILTSPIISLSFLKIEKIVKKNIKNIRFIKLDDLAAINTMNVKNWKILEIIAKNFYHEKVFKINSKLPPKIIFTDFDGCLTDDKVKIDSKNVESVNVNRKDGLAVLRLKNLGIDTIIISKETNRIVEIRAKKLGIPFMQGIDNKVNEIEKFLMKSKLSWKDIWYVGNDVNDLGPLEKSDLSFCPADATIEARKIAQVVLTKRGGEGVLAEIASILESNPALKNKKKK